MVKKLTYFHDEDLHNMRSPELFVPHLIDLFQPQSVVDFGCGIGNFLEVFHRLGVPDVFGVDGAWVDVSKFAKHVSPERLIRADLSQPLQLDRKFDLVISFEVAEHLSPESAAQFVETLTSAGDIIVFSAAIPFQAGQNHLNEQWPEYWSELFARHNFERFDLIRPRIWDIPEIQVWYRQNSFVYIRKGSGFQPPEKKFPENFQAIHPDMYHYKAQQLEQMLRGNISLKALAKIAAKAMLRSVGLR